MFSTYDEMLVAQNCLEYETTMLESIEQMSNIAHSCSNCINYSNGKCDKNLYNNIERKVKLM